MSSLLRVRQQVSQWEPGARLISCRCFAGSGPFFRKQMTWGRGGGALGYDCLCLQELVLPRAQGGKMTLGLPGPARGLGAWFCRGKAWGADTACGKGWFGATCCKAYAHIKTVLAAARWWVRKGAWSLGVRLDAEGLTSRQRSSGDGTVMAPGARGDVQDEVNAQGGGGPTGARLGVG